MHFSFKPDIYFIRTISIKIASYNWMSEQIKYLQIMSRNDKIYNTFSIHPMIIDFHRYGIWNFLPEFYLAFKKILFFSRIYYIKILLLKLNEIKNNEYVLIYTYYLNMHTV